MDTQHIPPQDNQAISLSSIHVVESHTMNTASRPPEQNENLSHRNVLVRCFFWVLNALLAFILVLWYIFYWLLRFLVRYVKFCILLVVGLLSLWLLGTLCSVTFPFLLVSWLVLRFLQFIKHGEDYDRVSQVKMVIECYMFINSGLLLFAVGIYSAAFPRVSIADHKLSYWSRPLSNILGFFLCRFFLLVFIQKYMPRMTLEHDESRLRVIQFTYDIVDSFLLLRIWRAIITSPKLQKTLGIWIDITLLLVMGWNIIALLTHLTVWSIHKLVSWYLNHENDGVRSHRYLLLERFLSVQFLVYYGNGIKSSFNFMLSSLLLLLVWVLHFESHLKTDSETNTVGDFGTWTCTSLLILSFAWVLKDIVLLSWEANAVYKRLSEKILEARKSLYFLGMLGRHSHDILKIRYEVVKDDDQSSVSSENGAQIFMATNFARVDSYYRDELDGDDNEEENGTIIGDRCKLQPKLSHNRRARARSDLLLLRKDTMTLFNVRQLALYFITAANALLKETYTIDIVRKLNSSGDNREILQKLITGDDNRRDVDNVVKRFYRWILVIWESLRKMITRKDNVSNVVQSSSEPVPLDWESFSDLLNLNSSDDIFYDEVKAWLEKSHRKCLFLANTLCSAKELVDGLNNIVSVLLVTVSFILWLIFTGLADTKVLVLIASPLLAATFIFGDTCKSLFQGIIYIYVVHPFYVGDLCVIDEKMVEVKSIGVWKTTFSNIANVGTNGDVIYPNSELAMKTFINHKTEFDWNDFVEFDVEHLNNQQIKELRTQIELLLKEDQDESMVSSHSVAVLSTGKEVKIAVRFRHKKCNEDLTYFECAKRKDSLRSAFILDVRNLAIQLE